MSDEHFCFRVSHLCFRYPGAVEPALDDVNVDLPAGKTIALLGPSGSGKTTLLALLGLLCHGRGLEGKIVYRNSTKEISYKDLHAKQQVELRLREFGFVLQTCYLLPHFPCWQNIALPLSLSGWKTRDARAYSEELLCNHIGDKELVQQPDRLAAALSLGQRQRIAVLRAVVHDPHIVFADEPTSNLDPKNTERTLDLLANWRCGGLHGNGRDAGERSRRTLVLVCHNLETALRRADFLVVLNSEHRLQAKFAKSEWPKHAEAVNALLGARVSETFPNEI